VRAFGSDTIRRCEGMGEGAQWQQFWVVAGRLELYVNQWRRRRRRLMVGKGSMPTSSCDELIFIGAVWWEVGNRGFRSAGRSGE
jgi:hypothetical protein